MELARTSRIREPLDAAGNGALQGVEFREALLLASGQCEHSLDVRGVRKEIEGVDPLDHEA